MTDSKIYRQGFSLLELVIAFFILASIGSAALLAIKSGSQETRFVNEQFSASLLSRKVIEDVFCEVEINPQAAAGIDVIKSKMVDGESHFFSNLEDSKPPYFQIEPGEGDILADQQPLYSLVEPFKISVITDLSNTQLCSAKVTFNWDSTTSKGMQATEFHFHNLSQKKEIDFPFEMKNGDLEKYICGFLYATQTQPIDTLLAQPQTGGRKETIEALGRIGLMSSHFFCSDFYSTSCEEIKLLEQEKNALLAESSLNITKLEACLGKLVKSRYELVKTSFQVFVFITPDFDLLMGNCNEANLGIHYHEPLLVQALMHNVVRLGNFFTLAVWQTIIDMQTYFAPAVSQQISLKKLTKISLKLISLGRILAYNGIYQKLGNDGKADYFRLLEQIKVCLQGRFPALERLILQEVNCQQNPTTISSQNPSLQNVVEFIKPGGKFANILQFIKDKYSL